MTLAFLCVSLIATPMDTPPPPPDVTRTYQEAKAQAGRSPEEQVRLALWCEAHGLTAQRLHHLTLAILADPKNATARGLLGLVAHQGRWRRPEAVADDAKADADLAARLAEYNTRRAKAPDTVEAQWKLALWCEENGLKPEATAHLSAVVRLDPSHENAWKRLGCKKYEGRWLNDAAIARERADAEARKQADKKWKPLLERYREALRGKDEARRVEAEKALDDLTDPRAVRWVWSTFATGGAWGQAVAVRVFGQIDAPDASKALALLSVFGESAEVRRAATETLKLRDAREYAGLLIALLQDEIKYEVRPVDGPGSPGVLFVQGRRFDVQRLYSPPAVPADLAWRLQWANGYDANGLPVDEAFSPTRIETAESRQLLGRYNMHQFMNLNPGDSRIARVVHEAQHHAPEMVQDFLRGDLRSARVEGRVPANYLAEQRNPRNYFNNILEFDIFKTTTYSQPVANEVVLPVGQMAVEYQKAAYAAQQQLAADVALVDRSNARVKRSNDRITQVLRAVSGEALPADREKWKAWFVYLKGYVYNPPPDLPRPTIVEDVPLAYQPQPLGVSQFDRTMGPMTASDSLSANVGSKIQRDCFGAGTLVRTLTGPRPIESLRVGDRVLTQNIATGALGYRPVIGMYHNPPNPTFLVKMKDDTIVTTPVHRFWKVGTGWVMAQDIRVGDRLRVLGGASEVTAVEEGKVQLVYNMDIAEDANCFVGQIGALVHDNTLPDTRLTPFDAPAKAEPVAVARPGIY